ncbi:hypothetical protein CYLTODRAFT_366975 [Cylindrobasidium torrendii FP15055 ss-10]|uniref:NADH dehydrogenase [ubiquinone] 1 beta subcomplex subunit 11, mitochondrial n=1 Tax=Cylindrobasidium torrendii FP15055 ss-10 TaxID=1314674 RepID=A0A0D7BQK3_9AGAR|nr:hypothetical protein CYLTODRAFT_366975 [Cylindrobasidium torrendii FP15055 ss-10]
MIPCTSLRIARNTRLASTIGRRYAHGPPSYNEPSGWLFGEKPPPAGQKRKKEEWENIWYIGMFGTMAFAGVMLYYKPDTSIKTWALDEARRRMDERGEKYKYEPTESK